MNEKPTKVCLNIIIDFEHSVKKSKRLQDELFDWTIGHCKQASVRKIYEKTYFIFEPDIFSFEVI